MRPNDHPAISQRARILVSVAGLLIASSSFAADPPRRPLGANAPSALRFVPENVDFFAAALRNGEQWRRLRESQAFQRFSTLPYVRMLWNQAHQTLQFGAIGSPELSAFLDFWQTKENRELLDLIVDLVSQEVFAYGDDSCSEFAASLFAIAEKMRALELELMQPETDPEASLAKMLSDLHPLLKKLKLARSVVGFRLTDIEAAKRQLSRLQALSDWLENEPAWAGRLRRETINGADFWTLRMDGKMIPWDTIEDQIQQQLDPEIINRIVDWLRQLSAAISIGVYQDFVVVAIGDTNDHLREIGNSKLLVDRAEFKPLLKHSDREFTSVGYVSKRQSQIVQGWNANSWSRFGHSAVASLQNAEIPAEFKAQLAADIRVSSQELKRLFPDPEPSATLSFTMLAPHGYERYSYAWGQTAPASNSIQLAKHLGGTPFLFAFGQWSISKEQFTFVAEVLDRALTYAEKLLEFERSPEELAKWRQVRTELEPLGKRFVQVTKDQFLDSLDGQFGLVMDSKLANKRWLEALPPAENPLPVPELALLVGLRDADAFRAASREYLSLLRELLVKLHELEPDEIPEIAVATPESRDQPDGTVHFYRLPTELGLPAQIAPNVGVGREIAVLSYSPQQSARILEKHDLSDDGPLAIPKQPFVAAFQIRSPPLIDMLQSWADYGLQLSFAENGQSVALQMTKEQIRGTLDFFRCWHGTAVSVYVEQDAVVTRTDSVFTDR